MTDSRRGQIANAQVAVPRQLTIPQRCANILFRYTVDGVALTLLETATLMPAIPQPFSDALGATLIMTNIIVGDAVRRLCERESPYADSTEMVKLKYTFVMGYVISAGLGVGFASEYLLPKLADSDNSAVQFLALGLESPVLHTAGLAAVTVSLFSGIKKLIDYCLTPPESDHTIGQSRLKSLVKAILRPVEPIAMYEALRLIMQESGHDDVLHHHYFPLLVLGFDQLHKMWGYCGRVPRPLDSLVPQDQWLMRHPIVRVEEGDLIHEDLPTNTAIFRAVNWYSLRALCAVTVASLVTEQMIYFKNAEGDQEQLSTLARLTELMLSIHFVNVAEPLFDAGAKLVNFAAAKLSQCWPNLFHRRLTIVDVDGVVITPEPTGTIFHR